MQKDDCKSQSGETQEDCWESQPSLGNNVKPYLKKKKKSKPKKNIQMEKCILNQIKE